MASSTTPKPAARDGGPPPLSMKLVIDGGARRVVFAEAGKDVADFLFSLLALPLARVAKLVADTGGAVGAVGNLRGSAAAMDAAYIQPGASRDSLLSPTVLSPPAHTRNSFHYLRRELLTCTGIYSAACGTFVTDGKGTACPSCGDEMATVTRYVTPGRPGQKQLVQSPTAAGATATAAVGAGESAGGFVRGDATYVVMDDLTVVPMPSSVLSNAELLMVELGALSIGDGRIDALQEKHVQFGSQECKEILKASLQSKTVLTDVFLDRKQL
ncbi:hypothetical protein ACP70R_030500 [Stipagrostis hirtigluma subsp. patula]